MVKVISNYLQIATYFTNLVVVTGRYFNGLINDISATIVPYFHTLPHSISCIRALLRLPRAIIYIDIRFIRW